MVNIFQKKDGFGIVEVMVAIFVITFGIVGVLALADQNIRMQRTNTNTLIASSLAQEGIEIVRNIRDKNWLLKHDWKLGLGAGTSMDIVQDGSYAIDYSGNIINVSAVSDAGANLKINNDGLYWHGVGSNSFFNRMISIVDNGENVNVTATISWNEGKGSHNYSLDTVLYNWK